jgi:transcriptional regulator with XRE-family HTH domain
VANNTRNKKTLVKFGTHLRSLRIKKGLSQIDLADNAEINKNQIGNIERGEVNPTLTTLHNIAKALEISINELMTF